MYKTLSNILINSFVYIPPYPTLQQDPAKCGSNVSQEDEAVQTDKKDLYKV